MISFNLTKNQTKPQEIHKGHQKAFGKSALRPAFRRPHDRVRGDRVRGPPRPTAGGRDCRRTPLPTLGDNSPKSTWKTKVWASLKSFRDLRHSSPLKPTQDGTRDWVHLRSKNRLRHEFLSVLFWVLEGSLAGFLGCTFEVWPDEVWPANKLRCQRHFGSRNASH